MHNGFNWPERNNIGYTPYMATKQNKPWNPIFYPQILNVILESELDDLIITTPIYRKNGVKLHLDYLVF